MFQSALAFASLEGNGRWDAEFYHLSYAELRQALLAKGAVPLGSFAVEAVRGVGPNYDPTGTVRVINSVNIRDLEISDEREARVARSELEHNPGAVVRQGDLMITSTGIGTLGRTFCSLTEETYLADGHITIVRLKESQLAPYLAAFLQSPLGRAQLIQRRRGSSRQVEIYPDDIRSVLVPPFPEIAREIAMDWLDAVQDMSSSQHLYPAAEEELLGDLQWHTICELRATNTYMNNISLLQEHNRIDPEFFNPRFMLIDELLEKKRPVPFSEVVLHNIKGVQPSGYDREGDVIVIKSKDVVKAGINLDACERAYRRNLETGRGRVQANVLLTNMTGVGTLGRAAVVPESSVPTVISVDVAGWRVKPNTLPPDYLALFLNSRVGYLQSLRHQIGSSGQLHLYPDHILKFKIYVKRTRSGEIDYEWHHALAEKVRQVAIVRAAAIGKLKVIHDRFAALIGLRPRIYRE